MYTLIVRQATDTPLKGINLTVNAGEVHAIMGPNGSGKSTLLQVIGGAIMATEGTIDYQSLTGTIPETDVFRHVAIAAPYLELVEEMTAAEFLAFHGQFKRFVLDTRAILSMVGLEKAAHRQIRYFSSGMKQRLKLAQALFTHCGVLLLDEPCTNLDAEGIVLYRNLIDTYGRDKLLIVSSNDPQEYDCCDTVIQMQDFKHA